MVSQQDIIVEDISSPGKSKLKQTPARGSQFENSMGKHSSTMGGEMVDELINWAKDLPDDISVSAGQSFYRSPGRR
jgi:hypothetical protein